MSYLYVSSARLKPCPTYRPALLPQQAEKAAPLWLGDSLDSNAGQVERHRLECGSELVVLVERNRPALVERVERSTVVAGNGVLHRRSDDALDVLRPDLRLLVE